MSWVTGFWQINLQADHINKVLSARPCWDHTPPWQKPRLLVTRLHTPPVYEETSRRARARSHWHRQEHKCPRVPGSVLCASSIDYFLESSCEVAKGLITFSTCRQDKDPPEGGLPFPLGGCSHLTLEGGPGGFQEPSAAGSRCTPLHHILIWATFSRLPWPHVYFCVEPGSPLNSTSKHHA